MLKLTIMALPIALMACGGSGSGAVPFRTIDMHIISNVQLEFDVDRETVPGQIIFDPDPKTDASLTFVRAADQDLNGFEAYLTEDGSSIYLRSGTEDSVVVTIITDPSVAEGFNGSIIAHNSSTNLPLSGSADYAGDYAGILTANATGQRVDTVTGDVALVMDFDTALISGTISNRALSGGQGLVDQILRPDSTIAEGGTSGFIYPDIPGRDDISSGGFAALVAGPDAGEIVGYTRLDYAIGEVDVTENGAFRASR